MAMGTANGIAAEMRDPSDARTDQDIGGLPHKVDETCLRRGN
jgi:hypothetical protein